MVGRVIPAPFWFVAALVPMVVSQLVRLQQSDPAAWIFWDYAGRLGALAVLGAIPAARKVAFKHERLQITGLEVVIWVTGIVAVDHYLCVQYRSPQWRRGGGPRHLRQRLPEGYGTEAQQFDHPHFYSLSASIAQTSLGDWV
jgi:hypothetical protein